MNDDKIRELLAIIDAVLMPQLLACKVTLSYIAREIDGRSYAFDREASGGVDRLIDVLGEGGWVRNSIADGGDGQ